MGGKRRHFYGCTCCDGKYDVLAYNLDGYVVRRQYHGHGGYNLNDGYKPGLKISISADSGDVVVASDVNLSIMDDSKNGEATRFYIGQFSSYATGQQWFDHLNDGGLVRLSWRVAKKANTNGGKWLVSCTSKFLNGGSDPNPLNNLLNYYRMWLLDQISLTGVSVYAQPPQLAAGALGSFLMGNDTLDWLDTDPYYNGTSVFTWYAGTAAGLASFSALVDGHVPQSVLGDDVAWNYPYGIGGTGLPSHPIRASADGYIAVADIEDQISTGPLKFVEASHYYYGGAMLHYDGAFAYTIRTQSTDDGPVAGTNVHWSLHQTWIRPATGYTLTASGGMARYYDIDTEGLAVLKGGIVSIDEAQHWHGFNITSWGDAGINYGYGLFKAKIGNVNYIEVDFTDMRDWDDWFSGSTPETDLNNQVAASVRKLSNPFGTVMVDGIERNCIPKDVFCRDGFLYTLLADEDDPRYWRRLVKIDLTDFSVVWTKTPPEDWQCFHDLALNGDRIWVAVSASDESVFTDPE